MPIDTIQVVERGVGNLVGYFKVINNIFIEFEAKSEKSIEKYFVKFGEDTSSLCKTNI